MVASCRQGGFIEISGALCGVTTQEGKVQLIGAVIPKQDHMHKVRKSVLRPVNGWMLLTSHGTRRTPHGASRMVQAKPAWLGETRRSPSRRSCDTRVCDHATTVMHKLSTRPPPWPRGNHRRRIRSVHPGRHGKLKNANWLDFEL